MNQDVSPKETYRFILHLAAGFDPEIDANGIAALRLLSEPGFVQWNRLIFSALTSLRRTGEWSRLPDPLQRKLARKSLNLAVLQVRQIRWIYCLAEQILPRNIPVMFIKGSALLGQVYNADNFRASNDIDIMVHSKDLPAVCDVLEKAGAELHREFSQPATGRFYYQKQFRLDETRDIRLDVHRYPAPAGYFPKLTAGIWQNARMHPAFSRTHILVPSPADHVIVQAANASGQVFFEPHYFVDTVRLIRANRLDSTELLRRAASLNALVYTKLMLEHVGYWFPGESTGTGLNGIRKYIADTLLPVNENGFGSFRRRTRIRQFLSWGLLDSPLRGVFIFFRGMALKTIDRLSRIIPRGLRRYGKESA